MEIIHSDFKKGTVNLRITSPEDVWYLSHLVAPGDLIRGKTTRKIKMGEESSTSIKKTFFLTIKAETVEVNESGKAVRINGKVQEALDDIPKDSYHTIALEENNEFTLEKKQWLHYQKQKLQESCEKQYHYLLCLFDREEALFALAKPQGFETLTHIHGEAQKKRYSSPLKNDFYIEIIKSLELYAQRFNPECIVVASPAFYKEELFKAVSSSELKKRIVLATCSDVSTAALDEVMKRPELEKALHSSRMRKEILIVEELLREIQHNGKAAYGWKEVLMTAYAGAIKAIIITERFIHHKQLSDQYEQLDSALKKVDAQEGQIYIISSEEEPGKKVDGLGGIAALLRYTLSWERG